MSKNNFDRDHSEFPEIISREGEVLTPEFVAWSLTREGRRKDGREYPNPVPLEPPIGYVQHVPLHEQIAQMVRQHLAQDKMNEVETEDEANDFDVGDDYEPSSPWELQFEPTMSWSDAVKDIVEKAKEAYPEGEAGGGGPQAPGVEPQVPAELEVTNQAGKKVGAVKPK